MASVASFEDSVFPSSDGGDSLDWNDRNTLNFWIGTKFLEFEISRCVLDSISGECSYPELESALHERSTHYPYDEHLSLLRDSLSDSYFQEGLEGYEGFVAAVGSIVRKDRAADKKILLQSLRSFGGEVIPISPKSATNLPSPHHIVALGHHGDQIGVAPKYVNKTISFTPAVNEVTLDFQGWQTVAQAKTKKEAQQKVAAAACQRFGITVT